MILVSLIQIAHTPRATTREEVYRLNGPRLLQSQKSVEGRFADFAAGQLLSSGGPAQHQDNNNGECLCISILPLHALSP